MAREPRLDLGVFMGGVVIQNDMDDLACRNFPRILSLPAPRAETVYALTVPSRTTRWRLTNVRISCSAQIGAACKLADFIALSQSNSDLIREFSNCDGQGSFL